jgi:DNA repair exonuclease SbcCD ATPase subunit
MQHTLLDRGAHTMKSKTPIKQAQKNPERALLQKLTGLTKQISRGNYAQAKNLFELTATSAYPKPISELAESFGMMIVNIESREFKLEQLIEDLERSCKELSAVKKKLEAFNKTLEKQVLDRTEQLYGKNNELNQALKNLKKENKERTLAEKSLKQLYQQIEVTNQELQDAYLWMRQKKDLLEARKYNESIIFLTADDGRICGFTEQAREITKKNCADLQDCNIQDFLVPCEGQAFMDLIRHVRPRMSHLTTLRLKNHSEDGPVYEAKLTRIVIESKRLLYIVLYPRTGH